MKNSDKLKEAIRTIEDAGGFVMIPEDDKEKQQVRSETHIMEQKHEEEFLQMENESLNDFEKRKKQAFKEARHALYNSKDLSFNDIDDIFFENGIEPDYIEDWIESMI